MAATVGVIKSITEAVLGIGEVSIDNFTFKLFYKWSATMLIGASFLVGYSQYFGDPIRCEISIDDVYWTEDAADEDMMNTYCWMYGHLNLPHDYMGHCTKKSPDPTILYNTYYQWVSIFLMTMAILFYVPRMLWLSMEGGLMAFLCQGCQGRVVENSSEKEQKLLDNYLEHVHNKFNTYTYGFFFCELLNIGILVAQIFMTDSFLGGQFYMYGLDLYRYHRLPEEERRMRNLYDPMCEIFPKVGNCYFHRYNRAGGQQSLNAVCLLSLNMINDKVFALLWYWQAVLLIAGIIRVVTRGSQSLSSSVRYFLMKIMMYKYLTNNKHTKHIQHYVKNCSIGDWFVLYQMNRNMNKRFFAEFLALLSLKVNPDPYVVCDPEVDIDKAQEQEDANYFDEDDLEIMKHKLERKKAWRRKINFLTGKRHLSRRLTIKGKRNALTE